MRVMHATTPVKVNAWVDKRIAPLVEALSKRDEIITVASCEHGRDGLAYVHFIAGQDDERLVKFVRSVSKAVKDQNNLSDNCRVQIEWVAGADHPMATILVDPNQIDSLACAVKSIGDKNGK